MAVVVLGPNRLSDDSGRPEPQIPPPEAARDKEKAPDTPPKPDSDKDKPEDQPPKPKPPKVDRFPDLIGDMKGKGIGTHDAEGDQPLKAREADADQPFLSRDPRGPGRVGNDPSPSLVPPGEGGTGGSPGPRRNSRDGGGWAGLTGRARPSPGGRELGICCDSSRPDSQTFEVRSARAGGRPAVPRAAAEPRAGR